MADVSEKEQRIAAKMANYREAVRKGKSSVEQCHRSRARRYQLFEACAAGVDAERRRAVRERFDEKENTALRRQCLGKLMTTNDFEAVRVLGGGAFGVVHLVKEKRTGLYYALKQIPQEKYARKNTRERLFAERNILADARNRWFVQLQDTFQDRDYIFMVMEFVQGGDLYMYLMQRERLPPAETKFYMAELLEALDTVHKCGFIHRDIKPDNIMISATGHLKLIDFGLCRQEYEALTPQVQEELGDIRKAEELGHARRLKIQSQVGTPTYMAPEVLTGGMTAASDLWSWGVLTFECLVGCPPFFAGEDADDKEAIKIITEQVRQHRNTLEKRYTRAKEKQLMPPEAEKMLKKVLVQAGRRASAEQLRAERFFSGLDFATIHEQRPPIIPEIKGPDDASQFEAFPARPLPAPNMGKNLEFAHYDFHREDQDLSRPETVPKLFDSPR